MKSRFAVVTVTSSSFLIGSLILLYSFLKHNKWFGGDFIIIHDELELNSRKCFQLLPNIKFRQVSASLKQQLQNISQKEFYTEQFYSLETFLLSDYDKILFCDSDMLFCDSVENLFNDNHPFICCGDGAYYKNMSRDRDSFKTVANSNSKNLLCNTFNAGFMLIGKEYLHEKQYEHFIDLIDNIDWQQNTTGHTDQLIYNLYFEGKQKLINSSYNYLLKHSKYIKTKEKIDLSKTKVLHFNIQPKPWSTATMMWLIENSHDITVITAYKIWYNIYFECMQNLHLHNLLHGK